MRGGSSTTLLPVKPMWFCNTAGVNVQVIVTSSLEQSVVFDTTHYDNSTLRVNWESPTHPGEVESKCRKEIEFRISATPIRS